MNCNCRHPVCLWPPAYCLMLALTLLACQSAAADRHVVRLYPVATLNGAALSLADLSGHHAAADLQEALAQTRLLTPAEVKAGQSRRLRRIDIESAFYRAHPAWRGRVEFLGPQNILLRAAPARLPAARLERAARRCLEDKLAQAPPQYRNVVLRPLQKIAAIDVPVPAPTLQARCNAGAGLLARQRVWVDIAVAGHTTRSIPIWFAASGSRLAYVVKDSVAERTHLRPAQLLRRYVDLAAITSPLYRGEPDAGQLRFRRRVNPGEALVQDMLAAVPAVEMGAMVSVTAAVGKVAIETRALAMTDAGIGEPVRLKSLSSAEYFKARVVGENLAVVIHAGHHTGT